MKGDFSFTKNEFRQGRLLSNFLRSSHWFFSRLKCLCFWRYVTAKYVCNSKISGIDTYMCLLEQFYLSVYVSYSISYPISVIYIFKTYINSYKPMNIFGVALPKEVFIQKFKRKCSRFLILTLPSYEALIRIRRWHDQLVFLSKPKLNINIVI